MNKVVIVIPIYREQPTRMERLSLMRCIDVLGEHPIHFIAPRGMDCSEYVNAREDADLTFFPPDYFSGIPGYNRLMISVELYNTFSSYEFMLLYQLDAYVFRDELLDWCEKGFDYIGGAVHDFQVDKFSERTEITTLNGGFSLRKISSALAVLNANQKIYALEDLLRANRQQSGWLKGSLMGYKYHFLGNNTNHRRNKYDRNEDMFWARVCVRLFDWYTVAPIEEALKFSFDNYPEKSYELTDKKLPFACHAFEKHAYFWKKYIDIKQ